MDVPSGLFRNATKGDPFRDFLFVHLGKISLQKGVLYISGKDLYSVYLLELLPVYLYTNYPFEGEVWALIV